MKNANQPYLHDNDCERCVIGTILAERNAIHQVRELLTPKSFYNNFHSEIYGAILAMTDRGDRADMISIIPELKNARLNSSDMTILLYRPEVYGKRYPEPFQSTNPQGTALIDIAKGRDVGVFKFIVGFDAATTQFYELNERPILPFAESKDDNPF